MDILMTYWSSHWKQAVMDSEQSFRNHATTEEELRAFEDSLERRRPRRNGPAAGTATPRGKAASVAH